MESLRPSPEPSARATGVEPSIPSKSFTSVIPNQFTIAATFGNGAPGLKKQLANKIDEIDPARIGPDFLAGDLGRPAVERPAVDAHSPRGIDDFGRSERVGMIHHVKAALHLRPLRRRRPAEQPGRLVDRHHRRAQVTAARGLQPSPRLHHLPGQEPAPPRVAGQHENPCPRPHPHLVCPHETETRGEEIRRRPTVARPRVVAHDELDPHGRPLLREVAEDVRFQARAVAS